MTKIGELEIEGSLTDDEVLAGLRNIIAGFDKVGAKGASVNSDFVRMNASVTSLAKKFVGLGVVATTAIVGIASGAPQVAGSIARMGVQFDKLQRILGSELSPQFSEASDQFQRWIQLADENKGTIGAIADTILSVGDALVSTAEKASISATLTTREGEVLTGEPLSEEDIELVDREAVGDAFRSIPGRILDFVKLWWKTLGEREDLLSLEDLE